MVLISDIKKVSHIEVGSRMRITRESGMCVEGEKVAQCVLKYS
jgi:hypothetical protein